MAEINIKDFMEKRLPEKYRALVNPSLDKRFIVMKGSSYSGKSYNDCLLQLLFTLLYTNYNVRFFATTEQNTRATGYNQYIQCIKDTPEFSNMFMYSESPGDRSSMTITSKTTGSTIKFSGYKNIDESLKSNANITAYIFEEADRFKEDDIITSIRYARGTAEYNGIKIKPRVYLQLNPNECWIHEYFFNKKNIRDDSYLLETSWKDNPFLSDEKLEVLENIKKLYKEYPDNPTYKHNYDIYYLGKWSSNIGLSVFNVSKIECMEKYIDKNSLKKYDVYESGTKLKYEANENEDGFIEIYKYPQKGVCYIVGYDTRDDVSNNQNDYGVGVVLNAKTREIVASYRQNTLNSVQNKTLLIDLMKFYNYAWFVPETNKYAEYLLTQFIQHNEYQNYIQTKEGKHGVYMEKKSKPICINLIQNYIDKEDTKIQFKELLSELKTFIYLSKDKTGNSKMGAQYGKHDDCVMSLGVALYALDNDMIPNINEPNIYEYNNDNSNIINNNDNFSFGLNNMEFGNLF